ncbi:(2Fe-2S)-binding protein [Gemmobacter sp.]|uniref:(2Fe-2S)-binding protein n=1 Tax=Gemmobacter sp. TaxID=1898957 RepID=UPI002AFE5C34|nr:2Fe-2S iron-sulfur cluster-binding protein [Gemmobacter sp.]
MVTAFTLNGVWRHVEAPGTEPLLWVLRNRLDLKAARFGCGEGSCGACVVLVDGRVEQSCRLALEAVAGAHVETAEALVETGHPLVEAFAAERAGQCGYCLSGLLMRAKGLLDANPAPDRAAIVEALEEGLCRCGAHPRILRAVERAATAMETPR